MINDAFISQILVAVGQIFMRKPKKKYKIRKFRVFEGKVGFSLAAYSQDPVALGTCVIQDSPQWYMHRNISESTDLSVPHFLWQKQGIISTLLRLFCNISLARPKSS